MFQKSDDEFPHQCEKALLKSINVIGGTEFDLKKACEKENIIMFSKHYFEQYKKITGFGIENIEDFDSLINYLSEREPKFKTLVFNFDKEEMKKPSGKLFYTTFLNTFFLEESRDDLFSKCKTFLIKEGEMPDILTDWKTYERLFSYIYINEIVKPSRDSNQLEINKTEVIDKKFIESCLKNNKIPDTAFYQLQFTFNDINRNIKSFNILLRLLAGVNAFKQNKIKQFESKSYKKLIDSIRAKNLSLEIQRNRNTELENIEPFKNDIEPSSSQDSSFSYTQDYSPLTTYSNSNDYQLDLSLLHFKNIDEFWNHPYDTLSFENGIFFDQTKYNQNDLIKKWEGALNFFKHNSNEKDTEVIKFEPKNIPILQSKLYKIFVYDEKDSKWRKNPTDYNQFLEDKKNIINKSTTTPLIFYYNSKEDDIYELNSTLTKTNSERVETDEITVYLSCERDIFSICGNVKVPKEFNKTNPLILQLHVPKNKEKDENLKKIIFQISTFITFISDINIIILDKEHYEDQIDIINELSKIKRSYPKSIDHILKPDNETTSNKSIKYILEPEPTQNESDDQISLDENINVVDTSILTELDQDTFFKKTKNIILVNDPTFIYNDYTDYLINRVQFVSNIKDKISRSCRIFLSIQYINIKDVTTYTGFVQSLCKRVNAIEPKKNLVDVFQNFECIELTHMMTSLYFDLKQEIDNNEEEKIIKLKKIQILKIETYSPEKIDEYNEEEKNLKNDLIIFQKMKEKVENLYEFFESKRMQELEELHNNENDNDSDNENDDDDDDEKSLKMSSNAFEILQKVQKELYSKCPPMDNIFYYIISLAIEDKQYDLYQKIPNIMEKIRKDSKKRINRLIRIIKKKKSWSNNEIYNLKLSHSQKVDRRFYNLISNNYPSNEIYKIYYINEKELKNIINDGIEELNKEFNDINNLNKSRYEEHLQKLKSRINQGTNYHIRETEAETETELTLTLNPDDDVSKIFDPL